VSVCVSVTLSVNSPAGQTPQWIFTIDSLTDADLCKDLLLGVSMMNNHIYGSKVPQKPHFEGLNRHFKPNMWKIQIAKFSDLCIRLTWNLTGSCGQQQRLCGWSRMVVKQFQDAGWPPFWKSIYRHISAKNHSISMKFLYTAADFELGERHVIKNEKVALDRLRVRQNVFLVSR